jgi:hypothetical protein
MEPGIEMYELGAILIGHNDNDGTLWKVFSKGIRGGSPYGGRMVYSIQMINGDLGCEVDGAMLQEQYRRATPAELVLYSEKGTISNVQIRNNTKD